MIYICYGMKKSGSTLAYELTRAMLEALGHPNKRLSNQVIAAKHTVNFLSNNEIKAFDQHALDMLKKEIPDSQVIAIKTHGGPTSFLRELAAQGQLIGQANFRDPRDNIPSLLDAGERARRRGRMAFKNINNWEAALEAYEKNLRLFEQWADIPGVTITEYEEVAFSSRAFLDRVAAQLGCNNLDAITCEKILEDVRGNRFTQYNRGVTKRHRNDLSVNQVLFLTQRFSQQIDAYMSGEHDPLDRALLKVANQLPPPTIKMEEPPVPVTNAFEKLRQLKNKAMRLLVRYQRL